MKARSGMTASGFFVVLGIFQVFSRCFFKEARTFYAILRHVR